MRRVFVVLALVLLPTLATAQVSSLTWLRYYTAQPGKEEALTELLKQSGEKLAGKVTVWGIAVPLSHTEEGWTHLMYAGVRDWANVEHVEAAFASEAKRSALVAPNGIRDSVLVHLVRSQSRPDAKPRYAVINEHPIKVGRENDAIGLFNEWAKPVFDDLTARGKIVAWGHSAQNIVIHGGWTRMVWYFVTDLSALDEVNKSLAALPPQQLRSYWLRLDDMSTGPFRGQVLKVVHSAP